MMTPNEDNVISWFRALYQALVDPNVPKSLLECLDAASASATDPQFQQSVEALTEVVKLGFPLSRAMELLPHTFSSNHVAVIRYGEMYGEMDLTLERYINRPEDRDSRCGIAAPEQP
jgi:type II secretory pathway component PulF